MVLIQPFLVEHHVGLHRSTAVRAAGHAFAPGDEVRAEKAAAFHAVVAVDGAVKLIHCFAARRLMKPVDVLGDHRAELPGPLQLRQLLVGGVGPGIGAEHFVPVKAVKIPGAPGKIGVAEDGLRRLVVFLAVQAVHAAEIGDAALGGHPRTAEKNDVVAFANPLL